MVLHLEVQTGDKFNGVGHIRLTIKQQYKNTRKSEYKQYANLTMMVTAFLKCIFVMFNKVHNSRMFYGLTNKGICRNSFKIKYQNTC